MKADMTDARSGIANASAVYVPRDGWATHGKIIAMKSK